MSGERRPRGRLCPGQCDNGPYQTLTRHSVADKKGCRAVPYGTMSGPFHDPGEVGDQDGGGPDGTESNRSLSVPSSGRSRSGPDAIELVGAGAGPETHSGAPLPPYVDPDGTFEFERADGVYRLTLPPSLADALDPDSLRFGFYRDVNAGGGAEPRRVDGAVVEFPVASTRLPEELVRAADGGYSAPTVRARLYAEREDRRPVFGTTTVEAGLPELLAAADAAGDPDGRVDETEVQAAARAFVEAGAIQGRDLPAELLREVAAAHLDRFRE